MDSSHTDSCQKGSATPTPRRCVREGEHVQKRGDGRACKGIGYLELNTCI